MKNKYSSNSNSSTQIEEEEKDRNSCIQKNRDKRKV
jgi:hypothetical protein